jgi:hypothetical protein
MKSTRPGVAMTRSPAIPSVVPAVLLAATVSGCNEKATLDRSQVEYVTVEGRRFEVRIASTGVEDEYRMLVVRAALVVNPDAEREYQRAWAVARQFMARTCKGRDYQVLEDNLAGEVNLQTRFRCS